MQRDNLLSVVSHSPGSSQISTALYLVGSPQTLPSGRNTARSERPRVNIAKWLIASALAEAFLFFLRCALLSSA